MEDLKSDIKEPVLVRPDFSKHLYLKNDCPAGVMGEILPKAYNNHVASKAYKEKEKGQPFFSLLFGNKDMWLILVYQLSRLCTNNYRSYYKYVGEAATGVWEIKCLCHFLYERELSFLVYCRGLKCFFQG